MTSSQKYWDCAMSSIRTGSLTLRDDWLHKSGDDREKAAGTERFKRKVLGRRSADFRDFPACIPNCFSAGSLSTAPTSDSSAYKSELLFLSFSGVCCSYFSRMWGFATVIMECLFLLTPCFPCILSEGKCWTKLNYRTVNLLYLNLAVWTLRDS